MIRGGVGFDQRGKSLGEPVRRQSRNDLTIGIPRRREGNRDGAFLRTGKESKTGKSLPGF